MKLITNNKDAFDNKGIVIRADVSLDGKSTTFKVFQDGVLLDTITDDSVLTVARDDNDQNRADRKAQIAVNAYSKVRA